MPHLGVSVYGCVRELMNVEEKVGVMTKKGEGRWRAILFRILRC